MGVPKLFTVINKNNVTYSAIIENLNSKVDVEYFYIDFNSIVHVTSQILIIELNEILLILLSLKSKKDLKNNKPIEKIVKKYKPYLNNFFDNFSNFESENEIGTQYNVYFSIDLVDEIVINLVKDNVHYLLKKFVKGVSKLLYIAVDGVPSKSKMIEQKKRRYMGAIVSEYKKLLRKKYNTDLENAKTLYGSNRLIYEKNKISFNKSKISPGTKFMDKLTNVLEKETFNCQKYILSSIDEVGEGEKKIIDHIKNNNYEKCMIYSPDADMILLTSLLEGKGNVILRHNQQKSTIDETFYDLIDIDIFKKNIHDYLDDKTVNKKFFIKDMICLASVFGNDFIPKIESIDVQFNFEQLLDVYLATFKFFDGEIYLTEFRKDKNKWYLNGSFFVKFLEFYWDKELFNMKENYMMNNYKMYKMFKNIFSNVGKNKNADPNFVNHTNFEKMNMRFKQHVSKIFDIIKSCPSSNKSTHLELVNEKLHNLFSKDYTESDFLNHLKQLVQFDLFKYSVPEYVRGYNGIKNYLTSLDNQEFLKLFLPIARKNPEKKVVRSYRDDVYKNISKTTRHKNAINDLIARGEGTKFDKEYYIFSNMLDHYSKMLKNEPLNLVNMKDDPNKTLGNYYKLFFDVDKYKFIENKHSIREGVQTMKLQNGIKKYIEGLIWTFNYYYNETNNVSKWFYDGERAPILRDIYIYIKNNPKCLKKAYNDLKTFEITSLKEFFSPVEQLMYITPKTNENKNLIPKKYIHFFETNNYYLNIDKLAQNVGKEIDCLGARYLNRCSIVSLKNYDMGYDDKFIKELRLIVGSGKYKLYKKKYIETGNIKYKKAYKKIKNRHKYLKNIL